jgi:acetylornithine deacetylase/succinyl-diaminopimelate desuccinylase-like protein
MSPTLKLLRELIALPSVNPAFGEADPARMSEKRVAEFLAATAASAGLAVDLVEVLPGRPILLAVLEPSGKARRRVALAKRSFPQACAPGVFMDAALATPKVPPPQ